MVITQAQCEVCAVSEKDVEEALSDLLKYHTQLISLRFDLFNFSQQIAQSAIFLFLLYTHNSLGLFLFVNHSNFGFVIFGF